MQLAQRMIVIITIVVVLMLCITGVHQEKEDKLLNQWEAAQTGRFLKGICKNGRVSLEEYLRYEEALGKSREISEIELTEYRKEQDLEGNSYYYMVSWEEIQKQFWKTGVYVFEVESVVHIQISGKKRKIRNDYYIIVSGEE